MKNLIKKLIVGLMFLVGMTSSAIATNAPTNVVATALSSTSIKVTWASTTSNVIGYTLAYGTATGFNTPKTYRWNGGSGTNQSYTFTGLLPNTTYYFAVKAEGNIDANDSPFSLFVSTTTPGNNTTVLAPTNLTCTALSTTSIKITWTNPNISTVNSNIVGFTATRGTVTGFNSSTTYNWSPGNASTTYTFNGLLPNTTYYFSIKAEGTTDAFDSPFTSFINCTTQTGGGTTSTPAPTGTVCTTINANSLSLSWIPLTSSNVVGYTVQYSTNSSFVPASFQYAAGVTSSSTTIVGLNANTTYFMQVKAEGTNDSLDSPYSVTSSCLTSPGTSSGSVHQYNKIVVVIGENTNASSVFGSSSAPYVNGLVGAKFTNSYGLTHPSQPNYLMLFSGGNQGVTGDGYCGFFNNPNLARELINAGKTFTMYSEDLPSVGYDGNSSGNYQRKHNPLAPFVGAGSNQVSSSLNQPWTAFPHNNYSNLPNVSFVAPNQCNDGHNTCSPYNDRTKQYDAWIQNNLNNYLTWARQNNSLLIITYDEDDFTSVNRIFTAFAGAYVLSGTYSQTINHYNVLRTIEECMGLTTHAGQAANNSAITYCWSNTPFISINPNGVPNQILYHDMFGTKLNPDNLPKNQIIIKNEIYNDTVKSSKFIIE